MNHTEALLSQINTKKTSSLYDRLKPCKSLAKNGKYEFVVTAMIAIERCPVKS